MALANGQIEINRENGVFEFKTDAFAHEERVPALNHEDATTRMFDRLKEKGVIADTTDIAGIGHRVVHGGEKFVQPTVFTKQNIDELDATSHLAPLHMPVAVAALRLAFEKVP